MKKMLNLLLIAALIICFAVIMTACGEGTSNSITGVAKTSTEGNVDTYTISYSDSTTSVFYVTNGLDGTDGLNGADGADGTNGTDGVSAEIAINSNGFWTINGVATTVSAIAKDGKNIELKKNSESGYIQWRYVTENWVNLIDIASLKGDKGDKGDTGEHGSGIASIEKISSDNVVDTYKITFDDQTSTTFTVTNGETGADIYSMYCTQFGYTGTLSEWLNDVTNGTLDSATMRTVNFDVNGGTLPDGASATRGVTDGRTTILPIPTWTGRVFLGWYTGSSATDGIFTNSSVVDRDLNLLAKWKKERVTVTFVNYDDSVLSTQIIDYGTAATAPADPTRENMIFDIWDKDFTEVTADITVKAVFATHNYTVSFDSDGGSDINARQTAYGTCVTAPNHPSRAGFVFLGWFMPEDYETEYDFLTPLNADVTVKAKWSDSVAISNYAELAAIADSPEGNYYLTCNINCNGNEWAPIEAFSGTLNGENYKVYNFVITEEQTEVGFIKTNSGTVENLTLSGFVINLVYGAQNYKVASLAVYNSGEIKNCTVIGEQKVFVNVASGGNSTYVVYDCGIVCENSGTVSDCTSQVTLNDGYNLGYMFTLTRIIAGSVGKNTGTVIRCTDLSSISIASSYFAFPTYSTADQLFYAASFFGGVVGINESEITSCVSNTAFTLTTNIDGAMNADSLWTTTANMYALDFLGGVAAKNDGSITKTQADVSLDATYTKRFNQGSGNRRNQNVGGLYSQVYGGFVGENNGGTIDDCRCEANMTIKEYNCLGGYSSEKFGAFCGMNDLSGQIQNSYGKGTLSSTVGYLGGFVGHNDANVKNSLSEADVTGTSYCIAGGFAGSNTGLTNGCIALGNINYASGSASKFAGESSGTVSSCCSSEESTIKLNGNVVSPANTLEQTMDLSELLSVSNIVDTLFWDTDYWGTVDGNLPFLKTFTTGHTHEYGDVCDCENKVCSICGYVVAAVDTHSFTDYVYNNDATCTENGTETAACDYGCGLTDTREIADSALGHSFTVFTYNNDATCTENGTETAYCDHGCGESFTREKEGSALGHYYIDGKCVRCDTYSSDVLNALDTTGYYWMDKDNSSTYSLNDYVYFGYYPQTLKEEGVTLAETAGADGYYLGSDNYRYARISATPYTSGYKFSDGTTTVTSGTVYAFRVEPIRWKVLSYSEGKLQILAEVALDNQAYQDSVTLYEGAYYNTTVGTPEYTYANDYEYSSIRAWLNDNFYNTAFSALQQGLIATTTVDNSAASTESATNVYACNNTEDNVYLLSRQDLLNSEYGFNTATNNYDTARQKTNSDYTMAIGGFAYTEPQYYGTSYWWTRSPKSDGSLNVTTTADVGRIESNCYDASSNKRTVVPALTITIA